MDVFSVEENEDAAKRENGIYWPPPHTHVQHECSKTESEQKLEVSGGGVLHSIKDQNGTYVRLHISSMSNLC